MKNAIELDLSFLIHSKPSPLEHSHQACQMPNIWHLAHQTLLLKFHEMCYMLYNFRTCYSIVSNMRRYGYKCHFRKMIFYSTFFLSSQYLIQCFLSLLTAFSLRLHLSLSLFWPSRHRRSHHADLAIADLATPILPHQETETAQLATDHYPFCDEEELQCEGHSGWK